MPTTPLTAEQLAEHLTEHLGGRPQVTTTSSGLLIIGEPLSLKVAVAQDPGEHHVVVLCGVGLGDVPLTLAQLAANATTFAGGNAPWTEVQVLDDGTLGLQVRVPIHGPIEPAVEFPAAIDRILGTISEFDKALGGAMALHRYYTSTNPEAAPLPLPAPRATAPTSAPAAEALPPELVTASAARGSTGPAGYL